MTTIAVILPIQDFRMTEATVHIDGGSRGNPGPAAYAVVLRRDGQPDIEDCNTIGKATNNVAEYTALIRALELAHELGVRKLAVFSDSELLVKQMNGEYKVKNAELQDLFREAQHIRKQYENVTLTHVRREFNKDADRLCNEALDGRPRRHGATGVEAALEKPLSPPPPPVGKSARKPVGKAPESLEAEGIALLNAVAKSWATHGPETPKPVEVWDQLWAMLADHGAIKTRS